MKLYLVRDHGDFTFRYYNKKSEAIKNAQREWDSFEGSLPSMTVEQIELRATPQNVAAILNRNKFSLLASPKIIWEKEML